MTEVLQLPNPQEEQVEPPCTDMGNAERFVRDHHLNVRYDHTAKRWLLWDGKRWAPDTDGAAVRRAQETIRKMYHRAYELDDEHERERMAKGALKSEAESKIRALLKLASCDAAVAINTADLDTNPWYFNCSNGTIDLRTSKLLPHSRSDLNTKLAPVAYVPTAACPRFHEFLEEVLPDAAVRSFVQRAVGYSLTAMTSERCLFILHGSGDNGKSTFLEILRRLLGDYARQADVSTFMLSRNDSGPRPEVVRLAGARFISSVEVEEGRRLAESLVKALTGNDMIAARELYTNRITEFRPTFKVWFGTNHKPEIRGTDNAIWNRIRLIPFDVTIPPEKQDKGLQDVLTAELPGILAWAVEGCLSWQQEGLTAPDAVRLATTSYRDEMDVIARFFDEHCIITPEGSVASSELYGKYKEWAQEGGERPMTQTRFGRRIVERFEKRRTSAGRQEYVGITLRGAP